MNPDLNKAKFNASEALDLISHKNDTNQDSKSTSTTTAKPVTTTLNSSSTSELPHTGKVELMKLTTPASGTSKDSESDDESMFSLLLKYLKILVDIRFKLIS